VILWVQTATAVCVNTIHIIDSIAPPLPTIETLRTWSGTTNRITGSSATAEKQRVSYACRSIGWLLVAQLILSIAR